MKKSRKKNQIVITALAVMIAVAGYLNFSGKDMSLSTTKPETKKAQSDVVKGENTVDKENLAKDDTLLEDGDLASNEAALDDDVIAANVDDSLPDAVSASSDQINNQVVKAQLVKEQNRSQNKEMLMEIVNSDKVSDKDRQKATKQIMKLSEYMEKESAAEQVLAAKGYDNSIVSMSDDNVDVMVSLSEITDVDRAKIEDCVQRKTGVSINNIVISSLK